MKIAVFNQDYFEGTSAVFTESIRGAYETEGLGDLEEDILEEIAFKILQLKTFLNGNPENRDILVAVDENTVLGTISFGPLGKEITSCVDESFIAEGELGSLYILKAHQGKGIGSALINAMLLRMKEKGVRTYALDSGYKSAQKRWIQKFGQPYLTIKDFWGPNFDHMIWLCEI